MSTTSSTRRLTCTTTASIVLLFSLIVLFAQAEYCNQCKPGTYCRENPEQPEHGSCNTCPRGYYCPGDAHYHVCAEGTASEDYGTVACKKCDQGRTGINRTYCLLPDAPEDIHTIQLDDLVTNLQLEKKDKVVPFTSSIKTGYNIPFQLALVMFRNADAEAARDTNLELYGSSKTGKPSQQSFEQHFSGYPTVTVPFVYSKETEFFPWYFTLAATSSRNTAAKHKKPLLAPLLRTTKEHLQEPLEIKAPQEATIVQAGISYHSNIMRTLKLNSNSKFEPIEYQFTIDREHGVDYWTYLFFNIINSDTTVIEQGTVLNITTITYNDACTQTLLYSEQVPLNPYPHTFTRDIVGDIEESAQFTKLNYITRPRRVAGPAYFAVSPFCDPYRTTPKLRVILHAVRQ